MTPSFVVIACAIQINVEFPDISRRRACVSRATMGAALSPYSPCKYCGQMTDFANRDCGCDEVVVTVACLVPDCLRVRLPRNATIGTLKLYIQKSERIPPDQQLLFWNGRVFAEDVQLETLGIRHDTTELSWCRFPLKLYIKLPKQRNE